MQGFKEVHAHYDFIVVGGGMTGVCAAIAAARHGAKTALIQDRPVLGGCASGEIRMHICGAGMNQKKPELNEGGILHEIMLNNKRANDTFCYSVWDAVVFDAARKEKNLTMYLNTTMHAAYAEGGKVQKVECYQLTTEKHLLLTADIFADCTGNGTLGAFVGAAYRTGSEGKGEFNEPHAPAQANEERMGNTLLFKAENMGRPAPFKAPVEITHFSEEQLHLRKHGPDIPKRMLEMATPEELRMMYDGYCPDYGFWWIELNGKEGDIVSQYEDIRDDLVKAVYGVWDHIKNVDHSAENYALQWVGMLPGARESRRMEGDYMLTENDVLENRRFADAVAYGGWQIDNHAPHGLEDYDILPSEMFEFDGSYDIPYRCYLAKGFDNLYVSGRSLSASKLAMASSRVMGTCAIGGQAIGTAAAQAAQKKCTIREIDMQELQQTLLRDDCYLPEVKNADALDLARTAKVSASSEETGYEAAKVLSGISRAIDGETHAWRSHGFGNKGEWLQLTWAQPQQVAQVQLTFDSNFDIEKKMTMSSRRQQQQEIGVPKELVRDFDVVLLKDGCEVARQSVTGNYQRLCRVTLSAPAVCDSVRIEIKNTNGLAQARVFEVRIYG